MRTHHAKVFHNQLCDTLNQTYPQTKIQQTGWEFAMPQLYVRMICDN